VSELAFLSPRNCAPEVRLVSPLARVLAEPVRDVSSLGKFELRGKVAAAQPGPGEELIPISATRALLVTDGAPPRLAQRGLRVYDVSGGLAAFEVEGERLLRRLTDLDLSGLPAAGSVARGVAAIVERRGGETFRIFVQQEFGHYVVEVVLDLAAGLAR
jgi:sarcosine oxidase gamma subunit